MRRVVNATHRPLKIHLPQGKVLHLGPHKEGHVAPQALESPGIKKLVEAGELEILADDGHPESRATREAAGSPDTHGHHPDTSVRNRGDR